MALGNWILAVSGWFGKLLHTPGRTQIPKPTSERSCESDLEKLQKEVENLGIFDLHDILRQRNRVEWCEWHLNIDQNDKAIEITNRFHQEFKKFKLSSSIVGEIDTIRKTFLKLKLKPTNSTWLGIDGDLKEAREANNPELVIKAYTRHQLFSEHINKHSVVNTYHSLTLYCTLLNCPILAHTQEYTEAFTKILFHPKLENLLVRNRTVYRGIVLKDKKLVENYKKGATIITTTFLSTSTDPEVARFISDSAPEDGIGILCTYNINNTNRHTALDLTKLAKFPQEQETLIFRYVPFTIESVEQTDDGRKMTVHFNECKE